MRTTRRREDSRVADAAGPWIFAHSPGAPERPPSRRVRVGSAGANFGPSRRKLGSWGRDWADFLAPADKKTPGGPSWGRGRRCSKEGGVSAIFDETPYINSFLLLHGKEFQKVGPIDRTDGFGFAFPKGSPLVEDLSKAMLNLIEGSEGSDIERKWFGDRILSLDYGSPDTSFSRLSSRSFEGLFIINGCILGLMFLINCSRYAYATFSAKRNVAAAAASDGEAQPPTNGNNIPAI